MRCCWWEYSVIDFGRIINRKAAMSAQHSWFYGFLSAGTGGFDFTWSSCGGGCHDSSFFFFFVFLNCNLVRWKRKTGVVCFCFFKTDESRVSALKVLSSPSF